MNIFGSDSSEESNLPGLDSLLEAVLTMESDDSSEQRSNKTPETVIVRSSELTNSQKEAFRYLRDKKVEDFFRFLIAHILINVPDDPVFFLIELLRECIEFRDQEGEPPLLFDTFHQEIIYRGMDPKNKGRITFQQYCNGLRTMGITNYNLRPEMDEEGMVEKEIFLHESDKQLITNLLNMIEFNADVEYEEEILPPRDLGHKSTEFKLIDPGAEHPDAKIKKESIQMEFIDNITRIRRSISYSDETEIIETSNENINERINNIYEGIIQSSSTDSNNKMENDVLVGKVLGRFSGSNYDVGGKKIHGTSSGKIIENKIQETRRSNNVTESSIKAGKIQGNSINIEKEITKPSSMSSEKENHEMSSKSINETKNDVYERKIQESSSSNISKKIKK